METITGGDWFGVNDAIQHLGISRKTLYKWIKDGKLTSEKKEKRRLIWIDGVTEELKETKKVTTKQTDPTHLLEQVEYFRNKVEDLENQIKDERIRHDTIILKMTEERGMLLDQLTNLSKPTWWKFWKK